jgi:hypothetical protein
MKLSTIIADFETQLSSSLSIGDTSGSLLSATDSDDVALPTGDYFFTIDGGTSKKEYISCTLTATAMTNIVSISRQGVETTGVVREHKIGATVEITDYAHIKVINDRLDGTVQFDSATPLGYDGSPTLTGDQFATVNYVLSVVTGGTVTYDTQIISNQTAGEDIVLNDTVYFKVSDQRWWKVLANDETTFDEVQLGICKTTATAGNTTTVLLSGVSTAHTLTAGNIYYIDDTGALSLTAGTNEVFAGWSISATDLLFSPQTLRVPTVLENQALMGSQGTPNTSNKYLTQDNTTSGDTNQTQTTQDSTTNIGEANTTGLRNKIAQSFIPTKTKIRGVNLYKSTNTGTFTGTVTVALQADSSGSPSGTNLASVTLTNTAYNALSTGAFDSIFTAEYSMTVGDTYWIVVSSSTSDTSNHPNLGINTAGGYTDGTLKYNNTTDGWVDTAVDLYFETLEGIANQVVMTDDDGFIVVPTYSNRLHTISTQTYTYSGTTLSAVLLYSATLSAEDLVNVKSIRMSFPVSTQSSSSAAGSINLDVQFNGTSVINKIVASASGSGNGFGGILGYEIDLLSTTSQQSALFPNIVSLTTSNSPSSLGFDPFNTSTVDTSSGIDIDVYITGSGTNVQRSIKGMKVELLK